MATKFLDKTGLSHFWSKIKAWCSSTFAAIAHTHTSYAVKHSYTTVANAAKNWYRIANANTQQLDTSKPIRAQFIVTAYNASYDAGYYETWFVNAIVFGRQAHIIIFGGSSAPFSQARILYENTTANIDANDRPAIDLYLNYRLANGTTKVEIEEIYNSGWTFLADGQLAASSVPSGFESVASTIRNNGIDRSTTADYASYLNRQISNITAAFTLADSYLYRSRTLNCTGTFTITIPSINSGYMWCVIKNKNTSSGVITLHPSTTSVLIDGSNEDITLQPMEYVCIHSAGANNYSLIADGRWKSQKANKATTLAGYGITDAKIANGTITLGSNSITPLTSVPSHNQASNTINAMTGYSKPSSGNAIATSDSLNSAIGKLEAKVDAVDDSNYVHLTNEETISGVKTVTGQFQRKSSVVGTLFRNPEAVRGITPSNNKEWIIPFCDASGAEWDSNGNHGRLGSISVMQFSDGQTATLKTSLVSYANIAGSTLIAGIDVGFAGENGDIPWAQAPSTRADRTAGNDIVTRDWLDNDASNLVHRSGIEVIHDLKVFDAADFRLRNTDVVKGSNPPSGTVRNWTYFLADSQGGMTGGLSNNGRMGALGGVLSSDGTMIASVVAYKNAAGSYDSQAIGVAYAQDGSCWGFAPSTSASRSSGTDIVTRDWIPKDTRIVHITGDETITGAKTFTSSQGLSMLRVLDRNQTLSSPVVLYGMQLNGKNSLNTHNLFLLFFERNPSDYTFGSSRYANRSVLRVTGATGKIADLSISMDDSNNVRVHVSTSSGANFQGYVGQNIINVDADSVVDSTLALRGDDLAKQRCGTVRFGNYNGFNTASIGASNESNSAPAGLLITNANGTVTGEFYGHYRPAATGTYNLGASSLRWANLYISASAVSTSDERVKSFISEVPDEVLNAWESVDFIRFKFNDSIAEKGIDEARYHSGLIAQRIAEAFSSHGLDASAYGLFCYDEWNAEPEVFDQNGESVRQGHDAGNLYSIRYEEALCMEAAYQRRKNKILENRISELEKRLAKLEGIIQ